MIYNFFACPCSQKYRVDNNHSKIEFFFKYGLISVQSYVLQNTGSYVGKCIDSGTNDIQYELVHLMNH